MAYERQYYEKLKENGYKPSSTSFGNQLGYMKESLGSLSEDANIQDLKNVFEDWHRFEREDEIEEKRIKAEEAKLLEEERIREIEEEQRYLEDLELDRRIAQYEAEDAFDEKFMELQKAFEDTEPTDIYEDGMPHILENISVCKISKIYENTMKHTRGIYPANEEQELEYNRFISKVSAIYFDNLWDVYNHIYSIDRISAFHHLAERGLLSLKKLIPATIDTYTDRVKVVASTIASVKAKRDIFLAKAKYERESYHNKESFDKVVNAIISLMDNIIDLEEYVYKAIESYNAYNNADPRNYMYSYCYYDHFYLALHALDILEDKYKKAITYSYELSLATNEKQLTDVNALLNADLATLSDNLTSSEISISKENIINEHKKLIAKYKGLRINIPTYNYEGYYEECFKEYSKYSALSSLKTNSFVDNPFSSIKKVDFRVFAIALCFVIAYFQVSKFGLDYIIAMFLPGAIISFALYKFFNSRVKKLDKNEKKSLYEILEAKKFDYFNFEYNNLEKKSAKEFVTNVLNATTLGKKEFYDKALYAKDVCKDEIAKNFKEKKNKADSKITKLAYGIIIAIVLVLTVLVFI